MIHWVILDPHGCGVASGSAYELPDGACRVPDPLDPVWLTSVMLVGGVLEDIDGMPTLVGGEWHHRPSLELPVITPAGFRLEGCPEGTTVWVSCGETGVVFGQTSEVEGLIEVSLPDPGEYSLEICPPAPWIKPEPLLVRIEA